MGYGQEAAISEGGIGQWIKGLSRHLIPFHSLPLRTAGGISRYARVPLARVASLGFKFVCRNYA